MSKKIIPVKPASPNKKPSLEKSYIFPVAFLFLICATSVLNAQTIWKTGSFTFTKTAPAQADTITANTHLTRGNSGPLYNAVTEDNVSGSCDWTPGNTQWAFGNINDWNTLSYGNLWTVLGCSKIPTNITSAPLVCHLLTENIYLQITFTYYQGGGGGKFTYTRTCADPG